MHRRDWWLGVCAVVAALLIHALVPRFEYITQPERLYVVRVDRWRGLAQRMFPDPADGHYYAR